MCLYRNDLFSLKYNFHLISSSDYYCCVYIGTERKKEKKVCDKKDGADSF